MRSTKMSMTNLNKKDNSKMGYQALLILLLSPLFMYSCNKTPSGGARAGSETDVLIQPQTETFASAAPKYPRILDAISKMEYPEYHSFIYRYERMRDEQLDLLEASIGQYGLRVDMRNSQSLNSAGYALYERKDYAGAVRFFREAAYVNPANVYPHYNLACTLSLLRDNIWADPKTRMDYHHDFNEDYYATKYNLYEPDSNYFQHVDNDEICRNEIFEHLTLACLLDRQYLAKAPSDRDLAGIHNTLRFRRLMENIQTGKGAEIYGVWYSPQGLMKESYFMLDGSMSHILPNDRPGTRFADFEFYADAYINNFTDDVIQEWSSQEYKFSQLMTGYECFDDENGENYTNQWDQDGEQLVIYSQMIISDYNKLKMFSSITPEYDFRYFKDILKVRKASLPALPMEQEKEYINVYASPYRHVMENDGGALTVESYGTETANTLAALALIHDCLGVLDMLINRHEDIDLNRLFLLSCLYAKTDLFTRFENGAYGFDMERFLNENGTILFKYVSASGNATFFKLIYSKYYQIVINNLSDKKSFLQELISWHFITGDNQMYNLIDSIREGKYNGDL